jgi:hypothetical protein
MQVELARRIAFLNEETAGALLTIIGDVGRLLHGLLSALDQGTANGKGRTPRGGTPSA